jgi:hypothetical protein
VGASVEIDVREAATVEVRRFDGGGTTLLVVVTTVGGLVVTGLVVSLYANAMLIGHLY